MNTMYDFGVRSLPMWFILWCTKGSEEKDHAIISLMTVVCGALHDVILIADAQQYPPLSLAMMKYLPKIPNYRLNLRPKVV